MSDIDIEADRKLCELATPGPWFRSANWHVVCREGASVYNRRCPGGDDDFVVLQINGPQGPNNNAGADFDFVVASRTALPEYIAEVERLRAELAELVEALRQWVDAYKGCDEPGCNAGGGLCADCGVKAYDCRRRAAELLARLEKQ